MSGDYLQSVLNKSFLDYANDVAVIYEDRKVIYREIYEKSNTIANWLISEKVEKGTFVGIFVEDRVELISIIIGVLKAGCVFVPIDSIYPLDRIKVMIDTVSLRIVLSDRQNIGMLEDIASERTCDLRNAMVEDIYQNSPDCFRKDTPNVEYSPDDKIYIYFTSGSTGIPKAILGRNQSLLHFIEWEIETFDIKKGFRISQFTSPGFDASLRDIFVALISGGTVCIPGNRQIVLNSEKLVNWIDKTKINLIHCTPSLFRFINNGMLKGDNFRDLRYILMAGEKITPVELKKWYNIFDERVQLVNLYGSTETTLVKTFYLIKKSDTDRKTIPAGQPMKGAKTVVVDNNLKMCPLGVAGEILIRTPYRTYGYYGNPEMTKEKFIPNPFNKNVNDIVYRTGDLGRILPDGNLEVLGRIDRQVKIRGTRVEIGEVENVLLSDELVKSCIVIDGRSDDGETYLCAYVVLEDSMCELPYSELRKNMLQKLPEYMIPQYFVKIDKIPVTSNGKTDFKALPNPRDSVQDKYIAPRNKTEEEIVNIWLEILKLEKVSVTQNFFQAGGHSLNMMTMLSKIEQKSGIKISLEQIFDNATVEAISEIIMNSGEGIYKSIMPAEKQEYYPVSSAQKRMYILNQFDGGASVSYNISKVVIIEGDINKDDFKKAFDILIKRHESLRTSFSFVNGEPVQRIVNNAEFIMDYMEIEECMLKNKIKEFIKPFDLSIAPLFRAAMYMLGEKRYALLFDIHHIIADGTSMDIIIKELISIYNGTELPEMKIQYKDFAVWQNEIHNKEMLSHEKYWLDMFDGEIPVLNMPLDFQRPSVQSFEGERFCFEINSEMKEALKGIAAETGTTLYMILLSVYTILLSRYTSQEDIVIGTPIAGRQHADLHNIVGMFVNTLAMRNRPEGEKTYKQFLQSVKNNCIEAYKHQDYPFEDLVTKLDIRRDMSRNPMFDTMFTLQNTGSSNINIEGLKILPFDSEEKFSKFDFSLDALETNEGIKFTLEYCTKLFTKETMETLSVYFINIIKEIVKNHDIKLSEIEILSCEVKEQILYTFNDNAREYLKDKTFVDLFEEQVNKTPNKKAVIFKDDSISYRELNEKANQLASLLREKGVKPQSMVGIKAERSIEMIVGILGIIKSGGAYVPIDPGYPEDRIDYMLEDSGADILLSYGVCDEKIKFDGELLSLEDRSIYERDGANIVKVNKPSDLLYVIYTSGTTGRPKGVMIEHETFVTLTYTWIEEYMLDDLEINLLQVASFAFDVFAGDVSRALLNGGTMVICPEETKLDPIGIYSLLKKHKIDYFESTPSLIVPIMDYIYENNLDINHLKVLVMGADVVSAEDFKRLNTRFSDKMRVINSYGVTEATVDSGYFEMNMGEIPFTGNVPIGRPLKNQKYYILDKYLRVQPVGVTGELFIGGDALARGYHNREDLTEQKFIPDPFKPDARVYRTGDIARWLHGGIVEFIGRADNQVKIKGYRIELGEIESRILELEGIKEAVVIARKESGGKNVLCAFIVASSQVTVSDIKTYLEGELPSYMVPSYIMLLDKLPLTPNGKINRMALQEVDVGCVKRKDYVAPQTENEKLLAEIWQRVIGQNQIGIDDDFFELGGDSIKVIQVISQLYKYKLRIDMQNMFKYPTIRGLAPYIRSIKRDTYQGIVQGDVKLTPVQKWFFEQSFNDMPNYNQTIMIYRKDGFDEKVLQKTITKVMEHHDALRMVYKINENSVSQYNRGMEKDMFSLKVIDLPKSSLLNRTVFSIKYVKELIMEELNSFKLSKGNLVKLVLLKTKKGDHLVIAIHHLVIDGYSWRIFMEDFGNAYRQSVEGKEIILPEKTDSYKEWTEQLYEYANSKELLDEILYWKAKENVIIKTLPRDTVKNIEKIHGSGEVMLSLSKEDTEALLRNAKRAQGIEINDIMLSALAKTIKEWTGFDKLAVTLEGHGREEIIKDINISRTIGWFTSEYPVVLELERLKEPLDYLNNICSCLRELPNKGVGYGILKYITKPENKREISFMLNPEISFNYLGQFDTDIESDEFEISEYMSREVAVSNEDEIKGTLSVLGLVAEGRLRVYFLYNMRDYRKDTIQKLCDSYINNLKQIVKMWYYTN